MEIHEIKLKRLISQNRIEETYHKSIKEFSWQKVQYEPTAYHGFPQSPCYLRLHKYKSDQIYYIVPHFKKGINKLRRPESTGIH